MSAFSDHFVRQIEADLNWRETELAILRKQLLQTVVGSTQERAFLRANLAMIYSHYEGFCKLAFSILIDALNQLSLKRVDLRWQIASHSLSSFHSKLRNISDPELFFRELFSELDSHLNSVAEYEGMETSNLWPDLLLKWQKRFCLNSSNVQNETARLTTLVKTRNQIAHGKNLTVANRAELDRHAHAATLAMHEVAIEIAESLEKRSFVRASSVNTIFAHAIAL